MCGVIVMPGTDQSGSSAGIGSLRCTSSAAPREVARAHRRDQVGLDHVRAAGDVDDVAAARHRREGAGVEDAFGRRRSAARRRRRPRSRRAASSAVPASAGSSRAPEADAAEPVDDLAAHRAGAEHEHAMPRDRQRMAQPGALRAAAPRSARASRAWRRPSSPRTGRCPRPAPDRRCARRRHAAPGRERAASRRRPPSEQTQPSRGIRAARPGGRRQPRTMSIVASSASPSAERYSTSSSSGASARIASTNGAAGIGCVSSRTFMRRGNCRSSRSAASDPPPGRGRRRSGRRRRATRRQLLAQEAAQQRHAAVAGAQMLGRMGGDRALADLGFVVAGEVAMLGLAQLPPELAVHLRAHPADVARLLSPARRRRCGSAMSSIGSTQPIDSTGPKLPRRGLGTTRSVGIAASVTRCRRRPPSSVAKAGDAARRARSAPTSPRASAPSPARTGAENDAVQDRHVEAVDHVLLVLQPVAGNDRRAAAAEAGVVGLERTRLRRAARARRCAAAAAFVSGGPR